MTTVNSATQSSLQTASATTRNMANAQDRFLKLLVTQMQNQDPLNPMDNAEVTSQMAQISTVTGIENLNTSMSSLNSVLQAAKTMQATSMIGRDVFVPGKSMTLSTDGTSRQAIGGFNLGRDADSVTVEILDAGGAVMQTKVYNDVDAGINHFAWDGQRDSGGAAPDGQYTFRVTAKRGNQDVEVTQLAIGRVNSVSLSNGNATLNVAGLGAISLDAIQQVL